MTILLGAAIAVVSLVIGAVLMSILAMSKISDLESAVEKERFDHTVTRDMLLGEIDQLSKAIGLDPERERDVWETVTPRTIDFRYFMYMVHGVELKCIKAPYDPVVFITAKFWDHDYLLYDESVSLEEFALYRGRLLIEACRKTAKLAE